MIYEKCKIHDCDLEIDPDSGTYECMRCLWDEHPSLEEFKIEKALSRFAQDIGRAVLAGNVSRAQVRKMLRSKNTVVLNNVVK